MPPPDPDDILADNPPLSEWPEVRELVRAAVLAERLYLVAKAREFPSRFPGATLTVWSAFSDFATALEFRAASEP